MEGLSLKHPVWLNYTIFYLSNSSLLLHTPHFSHNQLRRKIMVYIYIWTRCARLDARKIFQGAWASSNLRFAQVNFRWKLDLSSIKKELVLIFCGRPNAIAGTLPLRFASTVQLNANRTCLTWCMHCTRVVSLRRDAYANSSTRPAHSPRPIQCLKSVTKRVYPLLFHLRLHSSSMQWSCDYMCRVHPQQTN